MMELWIDGEIIGLINDYSISTEFDYIEKEFKGILMRNPTIANHYINIEFGDIGICKYLYIAHPTHDADGWSIVYYPPILLKTADIMELKSPEKVITCIDVKIMQETTARNEVRCHCKDVEMEIH